MWGFAVSLLLALLYPGSLLLPGIHGFVVQLTVAIFGTIVGDWVDFHSRIKGNLIIDLSYKRKGACTITKTVNCQYLISWF